MTVKEVISLTNKVYSLTLLFPKKEPLRYKIREVADDILKEIVKIENIFSERNENEKTKDIKIDNLYVLCKIIDAFFDVSLSQKWVKDSDLISIKKEYETLLDRTRQIESYFSVSKKETFSKENTLLNDKASDIKNNQKNGFQKVGQIISYRSDYYLKEGSSSAIKERQEAILNFLKEKGKAQVWQVQEIFPGVTKRTIRRDFEDLLKKGLVKRLGERNSTFYQLS
jgi:predicted DNA-binding transcriptional regulator